MAKFITITMEAFEALLKRAKKNGFLNIAERTHQDTAPSWMQGNRMIPPHKVPKRFQRVIDANKGAKDVVLPRSSHKNLVEAATAKKPLKEPKSGDDLSPGREIAQARNRKSGLVDSKKITIKDGPFKGLKATETRLLPSERIPSKKAKRIEEEMTLASRRRELRERAQSKQTFDIIDYLLSR